MDDEMMGIKLTDDERDQDGRLMMLPVQIRHLGCLACQYQFTATVTIGFNHVICPECGFAFPLHGVLVA